MKRFRGRKMTHYKAVSTKTVADLLDYASRVRKDADRIKKIEDRHKEELKSLDIVPGSLLNSDKEAVVTEIINIHKTERYRAEDKWNTSVQHLLNFIEQMEI